jgi:hypothetical protein
MIVAPSNRSKNLRGAVSLIHENQMKSQSQKEQICPKIGRNRNSRRSKFVRKSDEIEIAEGANLSENQTKSKSQKEQICPKIGRKRNRIRNKFVRKSGEIAITKGTNLSENRTKSQSQRRWHRRRRCFRKRGNGIFGIGFGLSIGSEKSRRLVF